MKEDMTVKEYAYHLLRQLGSIPESTLRKKLLEKYPEACVDCILREIRDEDPWVLCIPVENEKYNIKDRLLILLGADVPNIIGDTTEIIKNSIEYENELPKFHTPDGKTFTDPKEADKHLQQLWMQKEEED